MSGADSARCAARRNDFQYFLEAMKAMIEFLFGASYFENLELGYAEQDIIGVLYFLLYFYIANFIVLRMFIAVRPPPSHPRWIAREQCAPAFGAARVWCSPSSDSGCFS